MRRFDYTITPEHHGKTVQDYLRHEHGYSRTIITRLKREPMHILLNDKHIRMVDFIHTDDIITVILKDTAHLNANSQLNVPIVYEDEDLIVFNKPYNMPVHPSLAHQNDTLANYYTYHTTKNGENVLFRPINRLDTDTTGLCLVCKNSLVANQLSHNVTKEYTAIVCGNLIEPTGTINAPIGRVDDSIIKRQVTPLGQESITEYEVIEQKNNYTKVLVHLKTGRTHQIRVHFSHIGYPLAGDGLYGGDISHLPTQALTCTRLSFIHPISKKHIDLCINIPDFMQYLLK